jgi:hypothetical protein
MSKICVIGVITGDTPNEKVIPWLESLKSVGFSGDVVLIIYQPRAVPQALIDAYPFLRVEYINGHSRDHFMVMRFAAIYKFLKQNEGEYSHVLITDVFDVVFQSDPTAMLKETCAGPLRLLVATENLTYENEPWSNSNMETCFPLFAEEMKQVPINCAGVIGGETRALTDFVANIYLTARGGNQSINGGGPDQSAMNIVLTLAPWKNMTYFASPWQPFITHLGTSMPAIEAGSGDIGLAYTRGQIKKDELKFVYKTQPKYENGKWINAFGEPYVVVHQYNRVHV